MPICTRCGGTGRSRLGGKCAACGGLGQVNEFVNAIVPLALTIFAIFVVIAVLIH